MKEDILICDCNSNEHQIIIKPFEDDESQLIYGYIHLSSGGFFHRLKQAFRYVFGYKCKYGHWDEFLFKPEHADKLQQVVNFLKAEKGSTRLDAIKWFNNLDDNQKAGFMKGVFRSRVPNSLTGYEIERLWESVKLFGTAPKMDVHTQPELILAEWLIKHRWSVFKEADLSVKEMRAILNRLGYSANKLDD